METQMIRTADIFVWWWRAAVLRCTPFLAATLFVAFAGCTTYPAAETPTIADNLVPVFWLPPTNPPTWGGVGHVPGTDIAVLPLGGAEGPRVILDFVFPTRL